MNEKDILNVSHRPKSRKTTTPRDGSPKECFESPTMSKTIKLDTKMIFAVKTSNERNEIVEMAKTCTFTDLKSSLIVFDLVEDSKPSLGPSSLEVIVFRLLGLWETFNISFSFISF